MALNAEDFLALFTLRSNQLSIYIRDPVSLSRHSGAIPQGLKARLRFVDGYNSTRSNRISHPTITMSKTLTKSDQLVNYLKLARLHQPIGNWLFFWPFGEFLSSP
jgi:hypothetical protein